MNLVIVHDDFTSDVAQQLNAVISTLDDYQCRILSEKEWNDNKTQISSDQHVLFIGEVADALAIKNIIEWNYVKINMKYGWKGTRGLLIVEKHSFTKEEFEELKTLFEEQKKLFENKKIGKLSGVQNAGIIALGGVLFGLIGVGITTAMVTAINKKNANKIYKAEYTYMVNSLFSRLGIADAEHQEDEE